MKDFDYEDWCAEMEARAFSEHLRDQERKDEVRREMIRRREAPRPREDVPPFSDEWLERHWDQEAEREWDASFADFMEGWEQRCR